MQRANETIATTTTTPNVQAEPPAPALTTSTLFTMEAQDLKNKTRKLQLEIEEKNEIINILKDELETLREKSDKFQKENLQLVKDAKRVKFLQDENDFLQDKVGQVEALETELCRLKEKLNELEFLKLRITELEEDRNKAQEDGAQFEDKWQQAEAKLTRVNELELELNKWKSFSHELEQEKNSIHVKLLESIEQESKLNSTNKKVEDEVKRLRDLIRTFEEQRDEEQANSSLTMSVADLKRFDQEQQEALLEKKNIQNHYHDATSESNRTKVVELHEKEQQTDPNETREVSSGTELLEDAQQIKQNELREQELQKENNDLQVRVEQQDQKFDELLKVNEKIRDELEGNRRLISDLHQDLICEKSLAQKLANQLASFTKQIKSLDKQYFPIHDTTAPINGLARPEPGVVVENGFKKGEDLGADKSEGQQQIALAQTNRSTPITSLQTNLEATRTSGCKLNDQTPTIKDKVLASNNDGDHQGKSTGKSQEVANINRLPSTDKTSDHQQQRSAGKLVGGDVDDCDEVYQRRGDLEGKENEQQLLSTVACKAKGALSQLTNSAANRSSPTPTLLATSTATSTTTSLNYNKRFDATADKLPATNNSLTRLPSRDDEAQAKSSIAEAGTEPAASRDPRQHPDSSKENCQQRAKNGNNNLMDGIGRTTSAASHQAGPATNSLRASPSALSSCSSVSSSASSTSTPSPLVGSPRPATSNFVRNSLPSRSVNFGHSKSFAYLDRIRASVTTATMMTSSTNSPSSFSKNPRDSSSALTSCANLTATYGQQHSQPQASTALAMDSNHHSHHHNDHHALNNYKHRQNTASQATYPNNASEILNCMLEHQHSSRCFVAADLTASPSTAHAQASKMRLPIDAHYHNFDHPPRNQRDHSSSLTETVNLVSPFRSSRQVNALIDPVSDEQLMLSMLQHKQLYQQHQHTTSHFAGAINAQQQAAYANHFGAGASSSHGKQLTDQQIAHLNNLYRQHYYHHLHQLHQMHHHVHLHHKHHHQQQEPHHHHHHHQQQQQQQHHQHQHQAAASVVSSQGSRKMGSAGAMSDESRLQLQRDSSAGPYSKLGNGCLGSDGGSQFYAPDLVYANVGGSGKANPKSEQQENNGNHLVKASANSYQNEAQQQQRLVNSGVGRHEFQRDSAVRKSQANGIYGSAVMRSSPQHLGEINGLPTIEQMNTSNINHLQTGLLSSKEHYATNQQQPQRQLRSKPTSDVTSSSTPNSSPSKQNTLKATSSASTSPTSSTTSSNMSPSSDTSSSSSLNSLTASSMTMRSAMRQKNSPSADGNPNRRQFSIERELVGSTPLTATLSRVGSCRGPPIRGLSIREEPVDSLSVSQMRNPVKLQQPPMKTSKILNIGQQSVATVNSQLLSSSARQQQQLGGTTNASILANNLADIRLSDNLAFSSLRAPKKSSSGSNLLNALNACKLVNGNGGGVQTTGCGSKISSVSSSPDKRRRQACNSSNSSSISGSKATIESNNNNNNNSDNVKSSVKFKYGCV